MLDGCASREARLSGRRVGERDPVAAEVLGGWGCPGSGSGYQVGVGVDDSESMFVERGPPRLPPAVQIRTCNACPAGGLEVDAGIGIGVGISGGD
jgi:hypothetical protein